MRDQPRPFRQLLLALGLTGLFACTRQLPPAPTKVVFDQGHGEQALIGRQEGGDLSELARVFQSQGLQPLAVSGPLNPETLAGATAVVIAGPMAPLTEAEMVSLGKFLQQGGQLCLLLKVAPPATPLLQNLGLAASNSTINELVNQLDEIPSHFAVASLAPHPLTKGLQRLNLHDSLAINTQEEANVLATTSPQAWIDLNGNGQLDRGDAQQPFNVMVSGQYGRGRFVVLGSATILQNQLLSGQYKNRQLAENLGNWLRAND